MTKWEYELEAPDVLAGDRLHELGATGWEMCGKVGSYLCFKRPLECDQSVPIEIHKDKASTVADHGTFVLSDRYIPKGNIPKGTLETLHYHPSGTA